MLGARKQAGDTIIEVAIAFVVFGLLAVGASMIMNRGVISAQESLETTLVRQQMDAQAETLRYLHQEFIKEYPNATAGSAASTFRDIIADSNVSDAGASNFGDQTCVNEIPGEHPFLLRPDSPLNIIEDAALHPISNGNSPAGYAIRDNANSYGLWIEAVSGADEGTGTGTRFYDFHIRACWYGLSADQPRTLGTIVRLYVPSS